MKFCLVYPDRDVTPEQVRSHLAEFKLNVSALRDPGHVLVGMMKATITPEAVVYHGGRLVYRGRIDDRYISFGQARTEATHHDVEQILTALRRGENVPFRTTLAVGCSIGD